MPIPIKDLKKQLLEEKQREREEVIKDVINFLKENSDKAYTFSELIIMFPEVEDTPFLSIFEEREDIEVVMTNTDDQIYIYYKGD